MSAIKFQGLHELDLSYINLNNAGAHNDARQYEKKIEILDELRKVFGKDGGLVKYADKDCFIGSDISKLGNYDSVVIATGATASPLDTFIQDKLKAILETVGLDRYSILRILSYKSEQTYQGQHLGGFAGTGNSPATTCFNGYNDDKDMVGVILPFEVVRFFDAETGKANDTMGRSIPFNGKSAYHGDLKDELKLGFQLLIENAKANSHLKG